MTLQYQVLLHQQFADLFTSFYNSLYRKHQRKPSWEYEVLRIQRFGKTLNNIFEITHKEKPKRLCLILWSASKNMKWKDSISRLGPRILNDNYIMESTKKHCHYQRSYFCTFEHHNVDQNWIIILGCSSITMHQF